MLWITLCTTTALILFACLAARSARASTDLTPDEALERLRQGNRRFARNTPRHPHETADWRHRAANSDQAEYAYATIVSCSDSRVPVEIVFDAGIMDLFIIRVAGNVCGPDEVASIEYGVAHVKTPVLVVLGHSNCGAVTAACKAARGALGPVEENIAALLRRIAPATSLVDATRPGLSEAEFITHSIEENVWSAMRELFAHSRAVRERVQRGEVHAVGALYDLESGEVTWLEEGRAKEIANEVNAQSG